MTEDQKQSLRSFMHLADNPQAVRHAWECDENFSIQWLAKHDNESGKIDERQRKRKRRDRSRLGSAQEVSKSTGQSGTVLRRRQLEATQYGGDFFTVRDQNMNGLKWTMTQRQQTNVNELKSWTTMRLYWEAHKQN